MSMQTISETTSLGKLLAKAPEVRCKKCDGKTVKAGARKTARGPVQKYQCLRCGALFSSSPMSHRSYPPGRHPECHHRIRSGKNHRGNESVSAPAFQEGRPPEHAARLALAIQKRLYLCGVPQEIFPDRGRSDHLPHLRPSPGIQVRVPSAENEPVL